MTCTFNNGARPTSNKNELSRASTLLTPKHYIYVIYIEYNDKIAYLRFHIASLPTLLVLHTVKAREECYRY